MRTILLFLLCLLLFGCEKAETDTPPPPPPTLITMEVTMKTPGTLLSLLNGQEKLIENLTIKGEINGTDIRLIRHMAGKDIMRRPVLDHHLKTLNLSDAKIVEGGVFYYGTAYHYDEWPTTQFFTINNEFPILLGCENLLSVTLPNSITSISESAFFACRGITSITIPDNVRIICEEAFLSSRITSITIPENMMVIKSSAFYASKLTSITIPDNVAYLGKNVFYGCSELTSATIGIGVTSLEDGTFEGCPKLKSIYMKSTHPPVKKGEDAYIFEDIIYDKATLFVPKGSKAKYEEASTWSMFKNIVETDFKQQPK